MRKTQVGIVMTVVAFLSLAGFVRAQSAQPPQSNQSVQTPPNSGAQAGSDEALTPEAQAKLVRQIQHQLIMLPYYGVFDNLAFRLQGRTVILEGQVLRSSLKPDAERAVKKVEGVEKVINNIQVLPRDRWTTRFANRFNRQSTTTARCSSTRTSPFPRFASS